MNKAEILKNLNDVQNDLQNAMQKLNYVLSIPVWHKDPSSELDDTVELLHKISSNINDLIEIQRKILTIKK